MSTFSLTKGSAAALGMLTIQAGSETLLLTQPARELRAELSIEPFTGDSGDQLLAVLFMREQRHSMTLQRNDGANVQHLADWIEAVANGTLDTAQAIPQRQPVLLPCCRCEGVAIAYRYLAPAPGLRNLHGVKCRHRDCQSLEGAATAAAAADAWNAIQREELAEAAEPAPAQDERDAFYAGLYKKSAPMWHRLHELAVSKGYDHVQFAIECAPVYRCDCMGARKVAIDMAGNTIPCECVAAANETEPAPAQGETEPVYQFQWREIGEGDWMACSNSWFRFCEASPELDTRVVEVDRPAQTEQQPAYVECRECTDCGHVGINDAHQTDATCAMCDWSGPSPVEDQCPDCGKENVMGAACPKCSGRYRILAETHVAAPIAQTAPDGWQLVPMEPTQAMREAFHAATERYEDGYGESPDSQWHAMLRAALATSPAA